VKRRSVIRAVLAGLVALATITATAPANAATGSAAMNGDGTIAPGLMLINNAPQTFTFHGEGAIVVDGVQSTIKCDWSGNDTIGTFAAGQGSFSGLCTDSLGTVSIAGSFSRTLYVMDISAFAHGGGADGTWTGVCQWTVTSWPLVTYHDVCEYAIH
jgi:hypothetical protein